jgi:hypothetical protein
MNVFNSERLSKYAMLRRVTLVRTDDSEKCPFLQEPHGVTSHKMAFFIVTTVKTSNLI